MVFWGILWATFATDAPETLALVSAWVVPPVLLLSVWLLVRGLRWRADAVALRRIGLDGVTPQDGRVAVAGRIECTSEPVFDPVLGRKAAACHYTVYETVTRTTMEGEAGTSRPMRVLRAEGWRMAPCRVATDDGGYAALGGMADLEAIRRQKSTSGSSNDLQAPHFERASRWSKPLWRARLLARSRRALNADFRFNPVKNEEKLWGSSQSLEEGEQVCVVGRIEGGHMLPDLNRPLGIPVYPGTVDEALAKVHDDADVFVKVGGFLLAASVGWTFLLMLL